MSKSRLHNKIFKNVLIKLFLTYVTLFSMNAFCQTADLMKSLPYNRSMNDRGLYDSYPTYEYIDSTRYIVGPGDILQIVFDQRVIDVPVNPENFIAFENIGIINVGGMTLTQAKSTISTEILKRNKTSNCSVTLYRPRNISVYMSGNIANPGILKMPYGVRLLDCIAASGGFNNNANNRFIKIFKASDNDTVVKDLLKFYREGDIDQNPFINNKDRIFVDQISKSSDRVVINKDNKFYYTKVFQGESVNDIVFRINNYSSPPDISGYVVVLSDGKVMSQDNYNSPLSDISGFSVYIYDSQTQIFIGGAVTRSGSQPYVNGKKLIDYIFNSGVNLQSGKIGNVYYGENTRTYKKIDPFTTEAIPGKHYYIERSTVEKYAYFSSIFLPIISFAIALITLGRQ